VGVVGGAEDLVTEDREVALDAASGISASGGGTLRETRNVRLLSTARSRSRWCRRWRGAGAVLPDQIAGCRIERLNDAARIRQIHDAVVDERRRLLRAGVVHRPRPRQLKLPDVLAGDLIERTVAPGIVGAPPVQPVTRRRIAEHCLRHRTEVLDLRIEQETARHQNDRN
jgi:hypothetical protein